MNICSVLIGLTAKSRKGTSWQRVKRLFSEADPKWARGCIGSGLSSGEGLIEAVRDADGEHEGVADKRMLVMQGEFSSVLRVMDRDGNTLSTVLRDGWDGAQLRTMTRKSNALRSNGSHISLIGHITRAELRDNLTETDKANGFANRILWACVKRSKELPEEVGIDWAKWKDISTRTKQAVAAAQNVGRVQRDKDAQAIWAKVYHKLSEGQPGMLRYDSAERCLCAAPVLPVCAARWPGLVGPEHMEAALEIWRYCEDSARYIFGDQLGSPLADSILSSLRGVSTGFSRTEISNLLGRHKTSAQMDTALGLLAEHNLAASREETSEGRTREVWFAVQGGKHVVTV